MESIAELREKCQGQKKDKNFLSAKGYFFHRGISIYITKFLLTIFLKIRPNQVTFFFILVSIIGAVLLLNSNLYWQVLGIFLVYFGFLLDKVDGEIARYKQIFSLRGIYLDEIYHFLIPNILVFTFLYSILFDEKFYIILFFIIIMLNILNRLNRKIYLIIYGKHKRYLLENKIIIDITGNILNKLFNSFVFKIFSIIERFDLIIFTIFVTIILDSVWGLDIRVYYLYVYTILSVIYFLRWTWLNYFGHIENKVERLLDR